MIFGTPPKAKNYGTRVNLTKLSIAIKLINIIDTCYLNLTYWFTLPNSFMVNFEESNAARNMNPYTFYCPYVKVTIMFLECAELDFN